MLNDDRLCTGINMNVNIEVSVVLYSFISHKLLKINCSNGTIVHVQFYENVL